MEMSSYLFQHQQVKSSETKNSIQRQAGVILQDRTQYNGQLYTYKNVTIAQEYNQQENQRLMIPCLGDR